MTREGIHINGKEVIARYIGNRLVWEKETDKLLITSMYDTKWKNYYLNNITAETTEYTSDEIRNREDTEVEITRIGVDNRFWKAERFGFYFTYIGSNRYRMNTRIVFKNQQEKANFISFANSKSSIELKVYMEKR